MSVLDPVDVIVADTPEGKLVKAETVDPTINKVSQLESVDSLKASL